LNWIEFSPRYAHYICVMATENLMEKELIIFFEFKFNAF